MTKKHSANRNELQKAYDEGERDFRELFLLPDSDYQNINLSGADLRNAKLYQVRLSAANLSGANLGNANLEEADLVRANLKGANLKGAKLRAAKLHGADLSETNGFNPYNACKGTILPNGLVADETIIRVFEAVEYMMDPDKDAFYYPKDGLLKLMEAVYSGRMPSDQAAEILDNWDEQIRIAKRR